MNTIDDHLEDRLRRDLRVVAGTVTDEARTATAPIRHRKRRWALGIGALAVPVALAAGAYVQQGSEYVRTIPPESIIVEGSVDGSRYLLVETWRTDSCDQPVDGVELIEEDENLIGSEWNTIGEVYGEHRELGDCGMVTKRYLANPALYNDGGTQVGDSFVWLWAVHPDVTAVRITLPDGTVEDLAVHRVDGAGYALYEVPPGESYVSELVIGDEVVPGSREEQRARLP